MQKQGVGVILSQENRRERLQKLLALRPEEEQDALLGECEHFASKLASLQASFCWLKRVYGPCSEGG